jgi:regulator of replication initiation timing
LGLQTALFSLNPHTATTQWVKAPEKSIMQEEFEALEAQRKSLQLLVSELLLANQQLRLEMAHLRQREPNAPATHPQLRQDH